MVSAAITCLLPFVVGVFASSLPSPYSTNHLLRRDYATVSGVLGQISSQLGSLASQVKQFDGDALKAVPILDASAAVLGSIQNGTNSIKETAAIGLIDSISILYPVYTLNNAVDAVVNALIDKKPLFNQAFVTIVVADQLEQQKAAAQLLVDAVVSKLPAYIPGVIGTTIAGPVLTKLDKAVAAFKGPT